MKRFKYLFIGILIGLIISVGLGYSSKMQDLVVYKLLKTGQTTCYAIFDDGDLEKGGVKSYTPYTTGQFAGTVNVDCPHYAANTISFTAPNTISDAALGLITILTADTIRVYGSTLNDGVYTVAAGGVAGAFTTVQAVVNEVAGAYITLSKRATHSNNVVVDNNTSLTWARYIQTGKVGAASDGRLNWYSTATCFTLHPAAADLAMVTGNILRIEGSDESTRYFAGQILVCSGFTNAVNNLPGLVVTSVSFTGGNTDIVVDPGNQTLIAEAAGGSRTIKIVCQNIFAYAAAANVAGLGGYSDWRIPNLTEYNSIWKQEAPSNLPDSTAFPSFPSAAFWTSTTLPSNISIALASYSNLSWVRTDLSKTSQLLIILIRGG